MPVWSNIHYIKISMKDFFPIYPSKTNYSKNFKANICIKTILKRPQCRKPTIS